MKGKKNPFAFMSGTYAGIMQELKRGESKASYRDIEKTLGADHVSMLKMKKGLM